jgi:DNA-binding NtrC family response regulator
MKVGASDSIAEPFNPDQVIRIIETVLDSANQKQ